MTHNFIIVTATSLESTHSKTIIMREVDFMSNKFYDQINLSNEVACAMLPLIACSKISWYHSRMTYKGSPPAE